MAENAYLAFLRDPDQAARRAELTAFFGPNAGKFLSVYDVLQNDAVTGSGKPKFRLRGSGFSAPAFFFGPVWFFYRKMWLIAGIIAAGMVVLSLVPGTSRLGAGVGAGLAVMAYRAYVQHAIGKIDKLRGPDGVADLAMVAEAGGVSKLAAWISGTIYGLLALATLVSIYLLVQAGEPIPR